MGSGVWPSGPVLGPRVPWSLRVSCPRWRPAGVFWFFSLEGLLAAWSSGRLGCCPLWSSSLSESCLVQLPKLWHLTPPFHLPAFGSCGPFVSSKAPPLALAVLQKKACTRAADEASSAVPSCGFP